MNIPDIEQTIQSALVINWGQDGTVSPQQLSEALLKYHPVVSVLMRELFSRKIKQIEVKQQFDYWIAIKTTEAKKILYLESLKSNPTQKDVTLKILEKNQNEYNTRQGELASLEAEIDYLNKLVALCSEQQKIFGIISSNMRFELFSLNKPEGI